MHFRAYLLRWYSYTDSNGERLATSIIAILMHIKARESGKILGGGYSLHCTPAKLLRYMCGHVHVLHHRFRRLRLNPIIWYYRANRMNSTQDLGHDLTLFSNTKKHHHHHHLYSLRISTCTSLGKLYAGSYIILSRTARWRTTLTAAAVE